MDEIFSRTPRFNDGPVAELEQGDRLLKRWTNAIQYIFDPSIEYCRNLSIIRSKNRGKLTLLRNVKRC